MSLSNTCLADKFEGMYDYLREMFLNDRHHTKVNTGHWQGVKGTPHSQTRELMHVNITMPIRPTAGSWASFIEPNLPWAEDHFRERVAGLPLNPGEQYKNWPWYAGGVEDHKKPGQFSHTYMERFWPIGATDRALLPDESVVNFGIRYQYGDLGDLIDLLWREPNTRQAYLPIWFPEDLMATSLGERVPCTLGYHFMLRGEKLHCFYPMRSVDFVRYLKDDLYMAGRLVQHIIEELQTRGDVAQAPRYGETPSMWDFVKPGNLEFFASSMHIFEGDVPKLRREAADATPEPA